MQIHVGKQFVSEHKSVVGMQRLKNSQGTGHVGKFCVCSLLQKCHKLAVCLVWLGVVFS